MFKIIVFLLFLPLIIFANDINKININGFGTLGTTYNSNENTTYRNNLQSNVGSNGDISFSPTSKFGLQIDTKLNEDIEFLFQGIIEQKDKDKINANIQWLNLKYNYDNTLNFKLGKLRTPVYLYSDIFNVSYSYPWNHLPKEVYTTIPFISFDGIEIEKNFILDDYLFNLQVLYGKNKENVFLQRDEKSEFNSDDFTGFTLSTDIGNLKLRGSYYQTYLSVDDSSINELTQALESAGYSSIANEYSLSNKKFTLYGLGVLYDSFDWFFASEYVRINSDNIMLERIDSFYASLGYRFDNLMPYVTYSVSKIKSNTPDNRVPTGVNSSLDQLNAASNEMIRSFNLASKTYSLGLRYDIVKNIALKFQYDYIVLDEKHTTIHLRDNDNLDNMHILGMSVNFVF